MFQKVSTFKDCDYLFWYFDSRAESPLSTHLVHGCQSCHLIGQDLVPSKHPFWGFRQLNLVAFLDPFEIQSMTRQVFRLVFRVEFWLPVPCTVSIVKLRNCLAYVKRYLEEISSAEGNEFSSRSEVWEPLCQRPRSEWVPFVLCSKISTCRVLN